MASGAIKFSANSSPGERAQLSGSRLINAIVEQLGTGEVLIKRAPGLKRFSKSAGGYTHCRGMIEANDSTLLVMYDDYVESVTLDASGNPVHEFRGLMSGTDIVTLAKNNAATPDIVGVSPDRGAFILSATGAPAEYPDSDVGFPVSVCFGDGYFFFAYGDGSCIASGLNTTAVDPLDSIVAESHSGGLVRGVWFNGLLFLFGKKGTEVWQNTANPTGFPLSRSTVIPAGLVGVNAIAGYQSEFTSALVWVSPTNIVYQMNGYSPVRISTHDVERDLQKLADKSSLRCFVAMNNGHAFVVLKSDSFTWVFDLLTATWQERASHNSKRWRAECSVYAFGDWLLGDETNGKLYRLDNRTFNEDGDTLVWDVTSLPVDDFPMRQTVARADFAFTVGVGNAEGETDQEIDPTVLISWSDDSGARYGRPVERKLGKQGDYRRRVAINRAGRTRALGRQWNFKVYDAAFVGITGGAMHDTLPAPF